MSDNEYERFEITDYDLDNEFNPNRSRKKQTKQHQIYGIWADDSDNDDDEESSGRRRGGRKGRMGLGSSGSRSKDYTAPVNFVAGGIQQAGKKKDKNKVETEEDKENPITDEEDEINARPGFGIGARPTLMDVDSAHTSEESEEEQLSRKQTQQKPSYYKPNQVGSSNVGAWEQHTRGIGAKLLLQMGYKPGKGLGKDLQGISQPVEAHVRKGRGAIGAYGPETAASVGGKGQKPQIDEDVREAKEFKEKLNKWKKAGDSKQDKSSKRYYYKSVEEVLEKGKSANYIISDKLSKKLGNVPVIDMTGPEKRILSGYHAIGQSKVMDEDLYDLNEQPKKSGTAFALPELMHNLSLIVNMCEQDIISLDSAQNSASEKQSCLEQEKKQLEEIVKLESDHINTLDKVLSLVDELTNNESDLNIDRAEKIFLELQQNYAAEYKQFGLGDLAAGIIAPLLKNHLSEWKPLDNPTLYMDLIKKWRSILESQNDTQNETRSNIFDPYSSLVWAGVIPSFRSCAEFWDPKQHQSMAALLDCWAPLFPTWILDSVLEQLILPRMSTAVKNWDPLTDTVPIHIWILPWNSILGHKMEEFIFPTIREKLGNALQAWMPQDRSARAMLTPWKGAFDDSEMQVFLLQHIIPKLQMVLSEFVINPLQQDLEPWNQVWEWHELIPAIQMAQLLDKYFFPKWMQVLVLWLNQSPDYSEISRWYSGWKSMFSEEILREPSVKEHLRRALEIMHRATDQISTTLPMNSGNNMGANITATPVPPPPQPPPPPSLLDLQVPAPTQLDFKELVSRKCAERGVLFAPLPGRRELGKQIYRVGKLYCYIDRNVCMISDSTFKNWIPTPLQPMIERAITGILN
ncbi:septin interacting protein 1 [Cochliomyia hominivorax]